MTLPKTFKSVMRFLFGRVIYVQGGYYLAAGIWPLLDMAGFQAVTGPKTDLWLVKTVALMLMVAGVTLITAAYRLRVALSIVILGLGTAVVLIVIELVYVADGTISPVYLLDTFLELFFVAGWFRHHLLVRLSKRQGPHM